MVALVALNAVKESLPEYAHVNSPQKFTQHQLFACLVLKRFLDLDYRGIYAVLCEWPAIPRCLGLEKVPHFITLQQAHQRLLAAKPARRLLEQQVHKMGAGHEG